MFSSTQHVERLWTTVFFDIGWQGLCVAVLALVLAAALQRGWPRLAYGILFVALLKFLVPTSVGSPIGLASVLQSRSVSSFTFASQERQRAQASATGKTARNAFSSTVADPSAGAEIAGDRREVEDGAADGEPLYPSLQAGTLPPTSPPEPVVSWLVIAAAVHMLGSIGIAAYLACGWLHARRLVRANVAVPRGTIETWRQLQLEGVVPQRCRLVVTDQPVSPFALGIWNPVVAVPATLLQRLGPEQQKIVLAHEGGHHAAHHPLHLLLQLLVLILWWFHPLVWMLHRRIRLLREVVCDLNTLHALKITGLDYSRLLGDLSRWQVSLGSPPAAAAVAMHPIAWRISHLAGKVGAEGKMRRILRPLLLVLFALAVLPASGAMLATAPQSPTTATEKADAEAEGTAPEERTILGSSNYFLNDGEDGRTLLIPGTDFVVCYSSIASVYSLDPWRSVATLSPSAEGTIVRGTAVTPDGSQLLHVVAKDSNKIELRFYSIPGFELQRTTEHTGRRIGGPLQTICFSPDMKRIYFKTGFQVMRLDLQEDSIAEVIYSSATSIVQSRDLRTIGVAFYSEQQGAQLATYDTLLGRQAAVTELERPQVDVLGLTPDQTQFVLFSRSAERPVRFFDATSLKYLRSVPAPPGKTYSEVMTDTAWWRLISGPVSDDLAIQKIDLATGKEAARLPISMGRITLQAIDERKDRIIARNWQRLILLDSETARPLDPVASSLGNESRELHFAGAGEDKLVASDWHSADLWRWRPSVSLLGSTNERETVLDVSPSGEKLVVGGFSGFYRIVDLSRNSEEVTLQTRASGGRSVVFFSSSGEAVRILTNRYMLEEYDVVTGERIAAQPLRQMAPVDSWQALDPAAEFSFDADPFGGPNKTLDQIKRNQARVRAKAAAATSFRTLGYAATVSENGRYLAIIRGQRLAIADLEDESIHYEGLVDVDDRAWMDLSNDANTILIWQNLRSADSSRTGRMQLLTIAADGPRLQRDFSVPITARLSLDGRFVAVGSQHARSTAAEDLWLEVIDTSTGQPVAARSIDSATTAISWSRDGQHVATGHANSTVSVWKFRELLSSTR